jgi:tetratricopeptide (TPR) repeat protein
MRTTALAPLALAIALMLSHSATTPAHADAGEECRQRSGEAAIVACTAWLKEKPDAHEAYVLRGIEYAERAIYDRALEDYGKALAIRPDYVDALKARAFALNATGKREAALEDLRRAKTLAPDDFNIDRAMQEYGTPKPK